MKPAYRIIRAEALEVEPETYMTSLWIKHESSGSIIIFTHADNGLIAEIIAYAYNPSSKMISDQHIYEYVDLYWNDLDQLIEQFISPKNG